MSQLVSSTQKPMDAHSSENLRDEIIDALHKQGYVVENGVIRMPEALSKEDIRNLNKMATQKKMEKSGPGVKRHENSLIKYIANGNEVIPQNIRPNLVMVEPKSEYELLFRYACLHWSIPVSAGYGRRMRFVVLDESNGKLIGLFGLGDPVYSLQARDHYIRWDKEAKAKRLYHVMDAFVLGAVPPYSSLLCGKLIAMLICSNEVRNAFKKKYNGHKSLIRKETRPPYLALVTTTSALGRSSIYNRIRITGKDYWKSVGFTQGSGEFHFSNGVYDTIRAYVLENCKPTAKQKAWGDGFRNKREVIKKCLPCVGLSTDLLYHGIRREIFLAPLGRNSLAFLRGELHRPDLFNWPVEHLYQLFSDRWLISRAKRMPQYQDFNREQYRLWQNRIE